MDKAGPKRNLINIGADPRPMRRLGAGSHWFCEGIEPLESRNVEKNIGFAIILGSGRLEMLKKHWFCKVLGLWEARNVEKPLVL